MKYSTSEKLYSWHLPSPFFSFLFPFFHLKPSLQYCKMSVPWYAPGDPSYCQVKALAGNTVVYHQLSFVEYVEPESRKWHVRADRFAITCLGVSLIGESYVEYYNLRELPRYLRASLLTSVTQISGIPTSPALFTIPCLFSNFLCYAYNFTAQPKRFWHSAMSAGLRRALVIISSLDQLTRTLCHQTVTWDRTILSKPTSLGKQRRSLLVNRGIVSCEKPHVFHASSVTDTWAYSSVSAVWVLKETYLGISVLEASDCIRLYMCLYGLGESDSLVPGDSKNDGFEVACHDIAF